MLRNLPSELKPRISDFLDFEGIASIRLASPDFAVIGASRLWANGLLLRPYRNHMQRLTEACCCPIIVKLIDKLTICLHDTDQGSIKQVSILLLFFLLFVYLNHLQLLYDFRNPLRVFSKVYSMDSEHKIADDLNS
jgi:hypothetical protein